MAKPGPQDDTKTAAESLTDAFDKVSERVTSAYSAALEQAGGAVKGASSGLDANPLAALLGGLAIGAIAGALLPRLDKERELLEPIGGRVRDAARAALDAGRSAGVDALDEAGLSTDKLREQASTLFEQVVKSGGAAAGAAFGAGRDAAIR